MRPIDTVKPITFTYNGETFKRLEPNKFVILTEDKKELPITKESNKLMEALHGGEISV